MSFWCEPSEELILNFARPPSIDQTEEFKCRRKTFSTSGEVELHVTVIVFLKFGIQSSQIGYFGSHSTGHVAVMGCFAWKVFLRWLEVASYVAAWKTSASQASKGCTVHPLNSIFGRIDTCHEG